jgi:Zn-finger nucleic acid-binding protein
MKCPTDQIDLVMTERQGIEIDYCPTCRGIWLDRGELDKLIERAAPSAVAAAPEPRREERRHEDRPRREDDRYRSGTDLKHGTANAKPYKKRESFLSDIFDF